MTSPPRWIARAQATPPKDAAFERRAHAALIHSRMAEAMDARRLEAAPRPSRPWLLEPPPSPTFYDELARLAAAEPKPTVWYSPHRRAMLDAHLIETVTIDNLWAGDRLTEKGERELARSLRGE